MKLKRFNQFIKENIGEELPGEEFDSPEELKRHLGSEELGESDFDLDDTDDWDDENPEDFNDIEDSRELSDSDFDATGEDEDDSEFDELPHVEEEEVEEEGAEYIGTVKMKELARELNADAQGNEINYDGKKIKYYSEDEKFHIGKEKFEKIEEVLDFLNKGKGEEHGELEDNV